MTFYSIIGNVSPVSEEHNTQRCGVADLQACTTSYLGVKIIFTGYCWCQLLFWVLLTDIQCWWCVEMPLDKTNRFGVSWYHCTLNSMSQQQSKSSPSVCSVFPFYFHLSLHTTILHLESLHPSDMQHPFLVTVALRTKHRWSSLQLHVWRLGTTELVVWMCLCDNLCRCSVQFCRLERSSCKMTKHTYHLGRTIRKSWRLQHIGQCERWAAVKVHWSPFVYIFAYLTEPKVKNV